MPEPLVSHSLWDKIQNGFLQQVVKITQVGIKDFVLKYSLDF